VSACFDRQRTAPSGTLVVELTIDPRGRVVRANNLTSLGPPAIDACVVAAVRRWSFPAPAGGGVAVVRYPFQFAPVPLAWM
jgi:TonB family protein